jgi:hypothetical protein
MKLPKKTKPNSTFRRSKDTEMNNAYGFYGFRSSKKKADPTSIGAEFYSVGEFQASLRNWWKEKYTASPGCRFSSVVRYRICQSMTASCESMEGCNFNVRIELTIQAWLIKSRRWVVLQILLSCGAPTLISFRVLPKRSSPPLNILRIAM